MNSDFFNGLKYFRKVTGLPVEQCFIIYGGEMKIKTTTEITCHGETGNLFFILTAKIQIVLWKKLLEYLLISKRNAQMFNNILGVFFSDSHKKFPLYFLILQQEISSNSN